MDIKKPVAGFLWSSTEPHEKGTPNELGPRLEKLRQIFGLSRKRIAVLCGVTETTIFRLERAPGHTCHPDIENKIIFLVGTLEMKAAIEERKMIAAGRVGSKREAAEKAAQSLTDLSPETVSQIYKDFKKE